MNHQHHPKFVTSKLTSQKIRATVCLLILLLVVGLGKGVSCLINMNALSYQSYNKKEITYKTCLLTL